MRIISLLGFIIISASLLSESAHHVDANSFRIRGLQNSPYGMGSDNNLRRGLEFVTPNLQKRQAKTTDVKDPKTTDAKDPKATDAKTTDAPKQTSKVDAKTKAPAATTSNDPSQYKNADSGSSQSVPTESISMPVIIALSSIVGLVIVLAAIFVFLRRRKRKEMAINIVATSSVAWEQQNNAYEKMEDEDEPQSLGSYTVTTPYMPSLSDELDIHVGDKITILQEFDDGWVQGVNESRGGAKGVFPRHCVDMKTALNDKRSSSMGGYTVVDLGN